MPVIPPIGATSIGIGSMSPPLSKVATPPANDLSQNFGNQLTGALDQLNRMQNNTDALAQQAATGDLQSVTDFMMASSETQLATQLTVALRNKAVDAFTEIMRMGV